MVEVVGFLAVNPSCYDERAADEKIDDRVSIKPPTQAMLVLASRRKEIQRHGLPVGEGTQISSKENTERKYDQI